MLCLHLRVRKCIYKCLSVHIESIISNNPKLHFSLVKIHTRIIECTKTQITVRPIVFQVN